MDEKKLNFVKQEFMPLIKSLNPDTKPAWGLMSVQQMVEHMSDSLRIANGKIPQKITTPLENIAKMKAFVMGDIEFKENTKNRSLPETPVPVKNATLQQAIDELQKELDHFFAVFENEPGKIIDNAVFGDLNYTEWVHLLYKHGRHHLKQFHLLKNN